MDDNLSTSVNYKGATLSGNALDVSNRHVLDVEVAAALATLPKSDGPLTLERLAAVRAQRAAVAQTFELSDAVSRVDYDVPGFSGAPGVSLRVHTPRAIVGPLPCIYWIHGGGFMLGSYEMEDLLFDWLCPSLGVTGISVDYRLAPENPYPAPLEDCYTGLLWTFQQASTLGIDPTRIGVAGGSAGGGLAAGLAAVARDREQLQLAFQILIYPMLDDRQTSRSSKRAVPIWSPEENALGWRSYLGDLYGTKDVPAYAAPARATELRNLPPAFICAGTMDGFCDEDIDYARKLSDAGVPIELHVYRGAPHGFDRFAPSTSLARRSRRDMAEWLTALLGLPSSAAVQP